MNTLNNNIIIIGTDDRKDLVGSVRSKLSLLLWYEIKSEIISYDFFANGECKLEIINTVRWHHVYLISDINSNSIIKNSSVPSFSDRKEFSELILDTANKYWAETINIISTCFPYARQDKPNYYWNQEWAPRKPWWARRIARTYENMWIKNCITIDIHNPATGDQFEHTKFTNLGTGWIIDQVIQLEQLDKYNTTLSGTDEWSYKKVSAIAKDLQLKTTVTFKSRDYSQSDSIEEILIYGDIENRDIIVYDDMIDTASTLIKLLEKLQTMKPKKVIVVATHGMFNNNAYQLIENAICKWLLDKIYVTNTIYRTDSNDCIHTIDISTILAHTLSSITNNTWIHHNNNTPII